MSVAVITPYWKTPIAFFQKCIDSVCQQTLPCTHILVYDGDFPTGVELSANVQILQLPKPHNDAGNAARAIGSVSAICQGFDAITYLDADNWYEPTHIEQMWEAHQRTGAAVCSCARNLVDREGKLLGVCPEVDGEQFVDTNCLFLTRKAFGVISQWYLVPHELRQIGDRYVWQSIKKSRLKRIHLPTPTVWYRTLYAAHYRTFGLEPPADAKQNTRLSVADASEQASSVFVSAAPPILSRTWVPSTRKQTISLCMMVKNEEHNLPACLASVTGLVDEIVVVDTGSTDRTADIAREHNAHVVPFTWVDSFAAARNEGLQQAKSDWIFWMDADDRLDVVNRERFTKLCSQLPDDNAAYMMKQWSLSDHAHGSPLLIDHVRLFRKQPGVAWRYRVHEQILIPLQEAGAKIVLTDIVIQHLGYNDTALRRRKQQRNLRLLEIEYAEQPDDPFTLFNLASTYLDMGDVDQAMPFLHKSVEKAPPTASFLAKCYACLIQTYRQAKRPDEALRICERARKHFAKHPELIFQEGLTHMARKDPASAQRCFEAVLRSKKAPQLVGVTEGILGHVTKHQLALALRKQNRLKEAEEQLRKVVQETPHFGPAWLTLGELLIEQNRLAEMERLIEQARVQPAELAIAPALQARLCVARKELACARQILEDVLVQQPNQVWLRMFLSDLMVHHGIDLDAAAEHARQVLAFDPGQSQAKRLLERIQRQQAGPALISS